VKAFICMMSRKSCGCNHTAQQIEVPTFPTVSVNALGVTGASSTAQHQTSAVPQRY
jgi:hypothetical protein